MSWCATTWTPRRRGRRARSWCTGPSTDRRGLQKVAQFGAPVGPGTLAGFVTDSGLRPRYPAVEIYRVDAIAGDPGAPYLADTDAMARVDGGPEALLRLDERRRLLGQPPLGPVLLTARRRGARACRCRSSPSPTPRWRARPITAASTTTRRRSGRRTIPGTPSTGCPTIPPRAPTPVYGALDRRPASRCRVRRRIRRRCPTSHRRPSPAAAIDGDSATSLGVQRAAVGRRPVAAGRLRPSGDQRHHHDHAQRHRRRRAGPPRRGRNRQPAPRTLRFDEAGKPLTVALPYGETPWVRITADRHRRRVSRGAVRHHRLVDHPVRRQRIRPSGQPAAHRAGARAAAECGCRAMGSGVGSAGPAGLRRRARRTCTCASLDGAGTGGAGEPSAAR